MTARSLRVAEEEAGTGKIRRPDGTEHEVEYRMKLVTRVQRAAGVNEIEGIPELTIRLTSGHGLSGPAVFITKEGRQVDVDIHDDQVRITGPFR